MALLCLIVLCFLQVDLIKAALAAGSVKSGDCVCSTTDLRAHSQAGLSASVVTTIPAGDCGTIFGGILTKDGYHWYELKYNNQRVWAAGKYLTKSSKTSCSAGSTGSAGSSCSVITRSQWGARAPKFTNRLSTPVQYVFIHHTEGSQCFSQSACARLLRGHQNFHMDTRGWHDIGYSFLVGGDGNVYQGTGWHDRGVHTKGYNSVGIAVSFIGDFMSASPPAAQLNAAQRIINCGVKSGYIQKSYKLRGHRDMNSTDCPGDRLYAIISSWPHKKY